MANIHRRTVQPNQPLSDWMAQLWQRRETLFFFVWRDLKVQYQSAVLGLLWSIFQPLIYFGIILLVMNFAGRSSSIDGIPFQVYLISGLAIWNFVTTSITGSVNSLQSNASIITKASFPRIYLILAPIIKSCIDLMFVLIVVIIVALINGLSVSSTSILWLPLGLVILVITTIGLAAIATSLVAWNRHVRHIIPVLLYAGIFLLPVFYSASETELNTWMNSLNPISGSMTLLRRCFVDTAIPTFAFLNWAFLSFGIMTLGILIFRKTERSLADSL